MNRIIQGWSATRDGDLMLCLDRGVAYQADMEIERVSYDNDYLCKVQAYEGNAIARAVNAGRCALLGRHLQEGATVLDIGSGSGDFLKAAHAAGFQAMGYDVIPAVVHTLCLAELYDDDPSTYDGVTMWDAIEHMDDAEPWLTRVRAGAALFVSIPVFTDLRRIRESKHYRPGEHLYYWTSDGFVAWAEHYGFKLLERSHHESDAGRQSIGAFAFRRYMN